MFDALPFTVWGFGVSFRCSFAAVGLIGSKISNLSLAFGGESLTWPNDRSDSIVPPT